MSESNKDDKNKQSTQDDKNVQVNKDDKNKQDDQSKSGITVPLYRLNEKETEIKKLQKQIDDRAIEDEQRKTKQLEDDGRLSDLLEIERGKTEKLSGLQENFNNLYNTVREGLLGQLPEEKREKFKDVQDIPVLQDIVSEFSKGKKDNIGDEHGSVGDVKIKPMSEMNIKEKRENWTSILESYTRNKK